MFNLKALLKKSSALLILLGMLIIPSIALAAPELGPPDRPDLSTNLLNILFGQVSNVFNDSLTDDAPSLLEKLFHTFNMYMAIMGGLLVAHIVLISLANSAHSGTPLGQKWHSLFLPLRVSIGASFLIPITKAGYSLVQVITMWFILSGVQLANDIWTIATANLEQLTDQTVTEDPDTAEKLDLFKPMIDFAVCVGLNNEAYAYKLENNQFVFRSPSCGTLSTTFNTSYYKLVPAQYNSINRIINSYINTISNQFKSDLAGILSGKPKHLGPVLQNIQNQIANNSCLAAVKVTPPGQPLPAGCEAIGSQERINFRKLQDGLYNNILSVINGLDHVWKDVKMEAQLIEAALYSPGDEVRRSREVGWILAGSVFYNMVTKEGEDRRQAIDWELLLERSINKRPLKFTDINGFSIYIDDIYVEPFGTLGNLIHGAADEKSEGKDMGVYLHKKLYEYDIPSVGNNNSTQLNTPVTDKNLNTIYDLGFNPAYDPPAWFSIVSLGITHIIDLVIKGILSPDDLIDYDKEINVMSIEDLKRNLREEPFHKIAGVGEDILVVSERIIGTLIGALIVAAIAGALLPGIPYLAGFAGISIILPAIAAVVFAVFSVLMIFYPIGIIMNIYIPLIPTLIFIFGVLGWFMLCIESMLAAPLVALGLMHPNGDEVLGQAETGLKLLIGLLLRPPLMIIGLVAASILFRIILLFFTLSLSAAITTGLFSASQAIGSVAALAYMYVITITVLAHKTFSLINVVPDKIMSWIGAAGSSVGEAGELLQKAEGGTKEGSGLPTKTVKAGTSGAKTGWSLGGGPKPPA